MTTDPKRPAALIKGGIVMTMDPALGNLPGADILVQDGTIKAIGRDLDAPGAEIIEAAGMLVMPGLIDSHFHMWSTLGRNFIADGGFEYYPAKFATAQHYSADDFYNSVMLGLAELANAGVTTVNNWSHNTRSPAHADAELRAHRDAGLRARYSYGHRDQLPVDEVLSFSDIDRVREQYFSTGTAFGGLVRLGLNLRGVVQSDEATFHREMQLALERDLPVSIHASQALPNVVDAVDYGRRGYLGPKFLICHYIPASDADMAAMARTKTPLSYATISEARLGDTGDLRATLLKMKAAGVLISLSFDASSLSRLDMFELMRFTWNIGIPWKGTETANFPYIQFRDVLEMATINGAVALGLGDVTGSLTPGKRADVILIRTNDLNMAPLAHIETTIVWSATPANVDTVMVDGRILKRNGRLVAFDVEGIVERAKISSQRIRSAAGGLLANFTECGYPLRAG